MVVRLGLPLPTLGRPPTLDGGTGVGARLFPEQLWPTQCRSAYDAAPAAHEARGRHLGGGVLIALGLLTTIAAFVASGTMAVAYFMAHAPRGFPRRDEDARDTRAQTA